jgi:hypothetical protein
MKIHYTTKEELKKAVWRMVSQGHDISVDMKSLTITLYV